MESFREGKKVKMREGISSPISKSIFAEDERKILITIILFSLKVKSLRSIRLLQSGRGEKLDHTTHLTSICISKFA